MPLVQQQGQMGQKSGRVVLINGKKIIVAQKILGSSPGPKQSPKQLSSWEPVGEERFVLENESF